MRKLMDDALTSIESAVMVFRGTVIIAASVTGIVRLCDQRLVTSAMYRERVRVVTHPRMCMSSIGSSTMGVVAP